MDTHGSTQDSFSWQHGWTQEDREKLRESLRFLGELDAHDDPSKHLNSHSRIDARLEVCDIDEDSSSASSSEFADSASESSFDGEHDNGETNNTAASGCDKVPSATDLPQSGASSEAKSNAAFVEELGTDEVERSLEDEHETDILVGVLEDLDNNRTSYEEALSRLPAHLASKFLDSVKDEQRSDPAMNELFWWETEPHTQGSAPCDMLMVDDKDDDEQKSRVPRAPSRASKGEIDNISRAAVMAASPKLVYSIANVVAAYCVIMRTVGGDWRSDPASAVSSFWMWCRVVSADARFESATDVVQGFVNSSTHNDTGLSKTEQKSTVALREAAFVGIADAAKLLEIDTAPERALMHVHRLLLEYLRLLQTTTSAGPGQPTKRSIRLALKKLSFLAASSSTRSVHDFKHISRAMRLRGRRLRLLDASTTALVQ